MVEVNVNLRLSTLKPLHAGWVIEFYNEMASAKEKKPAGIKDVIRGLS